jgi:DNA-binding MarR family transcriptional regulator
MVASRQRRPAPKLKGGISMSRGYDGPEIDDFRDSRWERANSNGDSSRGSATDWRTRASLKLKLQKVREAESSSDRSIAQNRERSRDSFSSFSPEGRQAAILKAPDRSQYTDRDRTYALRPSEIQTLTEVGKFRIVAVEDLATHAYNGDRERMRSDLRNLSRQGLVEQRGTSPLKKESRRVLTLTDQGQRLIRRHGFVPEDQAIYSGLVKPKEADHDADLYRLYHKAADEIERKGGKVLSIQLDYELKEKLYQRLGHAQARGQGEAKRLKETFARDLQLPVVQSKASFPDLRIEYATQENEIARLDLELATRHYHAGHLAEKARAGFQLYARRQDAAGLRRVRDDREITAAILSL